MFPTYPFFFIYFLIFYSYFFYILTSLYLSLASLLFSTFSIISSKCYLFVFKFSSYNLLYFFLYKKKIYIIPESFCSIYTWKCLVFICRIVSDQRLVHNVGKGQLVQRYTGYISIFQTMIVSQKTLHLCRTGLTTWLFN